MRVAGAGICHTDLHVWRGDWKDLGLPPALPITPSHEISGVVVDLGEKVPSRIRVGQRVVVYPWMWSEEDEYVWRGCGHLSDYAMYPGVTADGGLREYFLVPHYRFVVDAEGLGDLPAASTLACAGLTTYRAVKKAKSVLDGDDWVVLVGLGGLGAYAAQWLNLLAPYANVIGVDVRDEAIEFVSRIAKLDVTLNPKRADPVIAVLEATGGKGAKAVIDLVGTTETFARYCRTLSKTGLYVVVGLMSAGAGIELELLRRVVLGEWSITGSLVGTLAEVHEVVKLAKKGKVNYAGVVTRRVRLEEVTEALELLDKQKVIGRQVVVF